MALLPLAMLKPLLMRMSQKLELAIIFLLVVINMVFTTLRTVYSLDVDLARFPDQNILWGFLQGSSCVVVCALPCYRGVLARKKPESLRADEFNTSEAEFADVWQRYLVSIGETKAGSRIDREDKEIEVGGVIPDLPNNESQASEISKA